MGADPSKVFIIHGRNIAAKNAVEQFLRSLKLDPIDFDELAADLGACFVGEIVRAGMKRAQGIIALFTADEVALLRQEYHQAHDRDEDLKRWQSRPNVIFEAGMAYGSAPKRTILVVLGSETKLFSDINGIHLTFLSNGQEARKRFRQKLIGAKCEVDQRTDSWLDPKKSGDFDSCIVPKIEVSHLSGHSGPSVSPAVNVKRIKRSRPSAEMLKHDKKIFNSVDSLLSEQQLRELLERLSGDHSYTDKLVRPVDQFLAFLDTQSNRFIIDEINLAAEDLRIALKNLIAFLGAHFFVYPNNQPLIEPTGFRYCMYPDLNVDRGGSGSREETKRYMKFDIELGTVLKTASNKYDEYRQAIKTILIV